MQYATNYFQLILLETFYNYFEISVGNFTGTISLNKISSSWSSIIPDAGGNNWANLITYTNRPRTASSSVYAYDARLNPPIVIKMLCHYVIGRHCIVPKCLSGACAHADLTQIERNRIHKHPIYSEARSENGLYWCLLYLILWIRLVRFVHEYLALYIFIVRSKTYKNLH